MGQRIARSFRYDCAGSTAIVFALALVPVAGMMGAAVDFSRASSLKSRMITAADAAALAAGKERTATPAQRKQIAERVFYAQLGDQHGLSGIDVRVIETSGGLRVEAGSYQNNVVMGLLGQDKSRVEVVSEVGINQNTVDIALVLDTTGSMRNDMPALKSAATRFTDIIFGNGGTGDQLRMSVVPFNAAVNVGVRNLPVSMVDVGGQSRWHASRFRDREVAELEDCEKIPEPPSNSPPQASNGSRSPGGQPDNRGQANNSQGNNNAGNAGYRPPPPPPPPFRGPRGSDRVELPWQIPSFAALARELFGISAAQAQVTPNTRAPFSGPYADPGPGFVPLSPPAVVPDGFVFSRPCKLSNPPRISHYDLFNRVPGTSWKGCVEARPEPYDVTDAPPSPGNPDTLFVPYFWPDEPGQRGARTFANSYMDDEGVMPTGWKLEGRDADFYNLFKYNGTSTTNISQSGPESEGPNKACPDELLRLTSSKSAITQKINSLTHWFGGGTLVVEGVMWGWRTLSSKAPFADGGSGDKNKKYMIVMSDGAQTIELNRQQGPVLSDYSAYGYIRNGRFPSEDYPVVEDYLDQRAALACENAKKDGIKIYSILFRERSPYAVELMKKCASDAKGFYLADDGTQLRQSFEDIAKEISQLRLVR